LEAWEFRIKHITTNSFEAQEKYLTPLDSQNLENFAGKGHS
jgi:hypothetical protein